jgi:TusA-related sulfurtransferase
MDNKRLIQVVITTSLVLIIVAPNTFAQNENPKETKNFKQHFSQKFQDLSPEELAEMKARYQTGREDHQAKREEFKNMTPEERKAKKTLKESITKTITKLAAGVQIELTSTNPEAITLLHGKEMPESHREEITRTKQNIENGARIIITSSDPALVPKIQARAEKNPSHKKGRRGFKGHSSK